MRFLIRHFTDLNLFRQLAVAIVAAVFLPLCIINGVNYYRGSVEIKQLAARLLDQLVTNIDSQVSTLYDENESLTLQLTTSAEIRQFMELDADDYYSKYEYSQWLQSAIPADDVFDRFPVIGSISMVGDKGIEYSLFNSKYPADSSLYDTDEIRQVAQDIRTRLVDDGSMGVYIEAPSGSAQGSSGSAGKNIIFARRVFSASQYSTIGTVFINIRADYLNRMWEVSRFKSGYIWIVDGDDNILYYPDQAKVGQNISSFVGGNRLKGTSGSFVMKWDGQSCFFDYQTSQTTKWKIVETIPVHEFNASLNGYARFFLLTLLVVLPLALVAMYLFIKSVLRPVHRLESGMREIGDGNWNRIGGNIPDNEIGGLMHIYNRMSQRISDLVEKVYKTELREKEAELERQRSDYARQRAEYQALQAQINPHFIYNTLGAINTYALMSEDASITEMIGALSRMLRYAVQDPLELVCLRDEVEHVRSYLVIQGYRLRRMPAIRWEVDGFMDCRLPRLTLQPLVENVFQHAFPDGIHMGHSITVRAAGDGKSLEIRVSDNGCGIGTLKEGEWCLPGDGKVDIGIGLMNVHKRLQIAFGAAYGLRIGRRPGGGTTVQVLLPVGETRLLMQ